MASKRKREEPGTGGTGADGGPANKRPRRPPPVRPPPRPTPSAIQSSFHHPQYRGTYTGSCVLIEHADDITSLLDRGSYGKGTLSRYEPAFDGVVTQVRQSQQQGQEKQAEEGKETAVAPPPPPPPKVEYMQLSPVEAFFLQRDLKCLIIMHPDGRVMSEEETWREFSRLPRWLASYASYHFLRSKGWVVRSGIKFGVDWAVYKPGGPERYHASCSVVVRLVSPSFSPLDEQSQRYELGVQVQAVHRVAQSVAKDVLLLYLICGANGTLAAAAPPPSTSSASSFNSSVSPATVGRAEVSPSSISSSCSSSAVPASSSSSSAIASAPGQEGDQEGGRTGTAALERYLDLSSPACLSQLSAYLPNFPKSSLWEDLATCAAPLAPKDAAQQLRSVVERLEQREKQILQAKEAVAASRDAANREIDELVESVLWTLNYRREKLQEELAKEARALQQECDQALSETLLMKARAETYGNVYERWLASEMELGIEGEVAEQLQNALVRGSALAASPLGLDTAIAYRLPEPYKLKSGLWTFGVIGAPSVVRSLRAIPKVREVQFKWEAPARTASEVKLYELEIAALVPAPFANVSADQLEHGLSWTTARRRPGTSLSTRLRIDLDDRRWPGEEEYDQTITLGGVKLWGTVVQRLEPSKAYAVRMRAASEAGYGRWTEPVKFVTLPSPPPPPSPSAFEWRLEKPQTGCDPRIGPNAAENCAWGEGPPFVNGVVVQGDARMSSGCHAWRVKSCDWHRCIAHGGVVPLGAEDLWKFTSHPSHVPSSFMGIDLTWHFGGGCQSPSHPGRKYSIRKIDGQPLDFLLDADRGVLWVFSHGQPEGEMCVFTGLPKVTWVPTFHINYRGSIFFQVIEPSQAGKSTEKPWGNATHPYY